MLRLNKEIPEREIRQMASHAALCCRDALLPTDATMYRSFSDSATMLSMQNLAENKEDDENNSETIKR